jgi:4'-phosphopantetheinyl transferase
MNDAKPPQLGRHVVVRLVRISDCTGYLPSSEAVLNEEDKARAARYRFPEDRTRFILGRTLLARALKESGREAVLPLNLRSDEKGRPMLIDEPELSFSISHSGELVGLALTLKSKVGVDFELISRPADLNSLSERIFSISDWEAFQNLPEAVRPAVFFRAWTAKEAYLKALGLGLPGGLREVAVPWEEADPSAPRIFHPDAQGGPWCLQRLPLPEGYSGCVVWDDPAKSLDFRVEKPTGKSAF